MSRRSEPTHRWAVLVAVAAVTFLLVACGGSSDEPVAVSLDYNESPINELLGLDIAMRDTDVAELEREAERGVVTCMLAAGFDYQPVDFGAVLGTNTSGESPDTREYAERNGYGISIQPDFDGFNPENIDDPNDELLAALTPTEREQYLVALYGEAPADDEPVSIEDGTGCVAESYRTVYRAQAELADVRGFFSEFAAELTELEDRFRSDPRFLELEGQWSSCMAADGYVFSTREEIFQELGARMGSVEGVGAPGAEIPDDVQAQMDAVSDWERAVAVADWDCTQPVEQDMRSLRFGYEALFLDEHGDRVAG